MDDEEDPFAPTPRPRYKKGRTVQAMGALGAPKKAAPEPPRPTKIRASKGGIDGGGGRVHVTIAHRIRAARKVPEAVVKIVGYGGGRSSTVGQLGYIGRGGEIPLQMRDGSELLGTEDYSDVADQWASADPSRRKDARATMHMMLSAPNGSDPEKVRSAGEKFCEEVFGENYPYAQVLHEDRNHPHMHIIVRVLGQDGKRFRVEKGGFQELREIYAAAARETGLEMNATPRSLRGAARSESHKLRKLRESGRPVRVDARAAEILRRKKMGARTRAQEKRADGLQKEAQTHRAAAQQLRTVAEFSPHRAELLGAAGEIGQLADWLESGGDRTRPDKIKGLDRKGMIMTDGKNQTWKGTAPTATTTPERLQERAAHAAEQGQRIAARMVEKLPEGPEKARAQTAMAELGRAATEMQRTGAERRGPEAHKPELEAARKTPAERSAEAAAAARQRDQESAARIASEARERKNREKGNHDRDRD